VSPTLLSSLKALHVLAAILFVGNVIVTGIWTAMFFRARHTHDFRVAARAIVFTDWIFTVGGGSLLTITGVTLALGRGYTMWGTPWIRQAIVALAISTVMWLVLLVPAQRLMLREVSNEAEEARLVRAYTRWNVAGWTATAPLLYAVWCMVAKPA
jgi:uncharacterized membrane protein